MKKLSSEVQDVTHEHSFSGAEGGYRCACGVIRPDRDDVPNAAFRRHGVQDVDRCVKCGHDAPLFDEPPLEGHCTVDIAVGNEKGGRPCGCKCEFPSTSVSEAAPERIYVQLFPHLSAEGLRVAAYESDPREVHDNGKPVYVYARVHQPPEQNSGKVLFGELWLDGQGEAHFVCHTRDDDFLTTKDAFQKFIALLETQLRNEKECPFYASNSVSPKQKALSHSPVVVSGDSSENADEPLPEFALADLDLWFRRVLGERLRYRSTTRSDSPVGEGYSYVEIPEWEMRQKLDLVREATSGVNALLANPITQDAGGLPSTTVPDPSQASSPKSESPSESESTLVTVATEALDEVLAFPHTADADTYLVARAQLAALKTHATVHQPDVQVVDEVSKEQDNAKS